MNGRHTKLFQVYSLVVQRDNRSNLDIASASMAIAKAAKDDSSAMRTLAFMSIIFLPGTFVSVSSPSNPSSPFEAYVRRSNALLEGFFLYEHV